MQNVPFESRNKRTFVYGLQNNEKSMGILKLRTESGRETTYPPKRIDLKQHLPYIKI